MTTADSSIWTRLHGMILVVEAVLKETPSLMHELGFGSNTVSIALRCLEEEKPQITESAVRITGFLLQNGEYVEADSAAKLVNGLVHVAKPETPKTDARRMAIKAIKRAAKLNHEIVRPLLNTIVPTLMICVRDRLTQREEGDASPILTSYLASLDGSSSRSIGDYCRRVLTKLAEKVTDNELDEDEM
ncbi:translational activator of GCN4 [Phlyctochytrium bullatum]|nr:translational activator of GCN4 [Phlyctochytrium bullatum]